MTRENLINFIPKPSNKEVIIYDVSLSDLIDVDVMKEYKELLPIFNLCKQQFLGYKNNLEEYQNMLNNIYLYKQSWTVEDYLFALQNDKKTYKTLYGEVKKIETKISTLEKNIKIIDEKIQMQTIKEREELEKKKQNIDKKIDENVEKMVSLREVYATLKIQDEKLKEAIKENQEDFEVLQIMVETINKGECKCQYCGSKLSNVSENSLFYKRTCSNLEKNKENLEKLLEKKKKNDEQLKEYDKQLKDIRQELNNDSKFKSSDFIFYQKKSMQVLKLEGQKDVMFKELNELRKTLERKSETKKPEFIQLKTRIEQCELSLENLKKIKSMKEKMQQDTEEYNKLKTELIEMKNKMEKYKTFLSYFFKIYEQKAAEFCGKDFKFKIFEFEDYTLKECFEIYYKNVKYENLATISKRKVEAILEEKFIFYQ